MESFSTHGLLASKKVGYWNEINSDTFAALEITPRDTERFDATLKREPAGPLTVIDVRSAAVRLHHTHAHVARTPTPSFLLLAPLTRELELKIGHAPGVVVHSGEFCLIDHARPYEIAHGDALRTLCIDVPRHRLEDRLPRTDSVIGRVMRQDNAMSRMLAALLQSVGHELQRSAAANFSAAFGQSLFGFLVATYLPHSEVRIGRGVKGRARAYRDHIDSRLTESELSPADVATHFRISERYLRAVLHEDGESFSAYLLRRRLERCASALKEPEGDDCTITEIAFRWGFSNATHFGQAFKSRYGITPREYRRTLVAPASNRLRRT
jgi:AraC family transcriptional activator of tynA and feaB